MNDLTLGRIVDELPPEPPPNRYAALLPQMPTDGRWIEVLGLPSTYDTLSQPYAAQGGVELVWRNEEWYARPLAAVQCEACGERILNPAPPPSEGGSWRKAWCERCRDQQLTRNQKNSRASLRRRAEGLEGSPEEQQAALADRIERLSRQAAQKKEKRRAKAREANMSASEQLAASNPGHYVVCTFDAVRIGDLQPKSRPLRE